MRPNSNREPQEIDPDKFYTKQNRRDRRRRANPKAKKNGKQTTVSVTDLLKLGPRAGVKSGKTGSPLWMRRLQYQREHKRLLEKIDTNRLEPALGEVAIVLHDAGFDNVWKVVSVEDIKTLTDTGAKETDLIRLRSYLEEQGVSVIWDR